MKTEDYYNDLLTGAEQWAINQVRRESQDRNRQIKELSMKVDLVKMWRDMPAAEMRLRCGEMTAQEIKTVRAVLNQIIPKT